MKVTVIHPGELGESEVARWRRMQRDTPQLDNPFMSPEFTMAVGRVRRDARVAVVTDGDEIVGFLPFEKHPQGVGKPIAGWLSQCQGLVHVPGLEISAAELLRGSGLHVWEFEFLAGHQPWFDGYVTVHHEGILMDVSGGYETYLKQLREKSPRTIKMALYRERKMGRDIGPVTFEFAVADPAQLDLLIKWKSDQYRRIGRPDRFAHKWVVELVKYLHETPGMRSSLSMLYADGTPVAGHFGLYGEHILAGWFPAYDPRFAKYSPGIVQHLRMAEAAAARGIATLDWGTATGNNYDYKDALGTGTHDVREGCVRRRSAGAALHWARHTPVRRARRFVLENPRLRAGADRVLRTYGRLRGGGSTAGKPQPDAGGADGGA